MSTTITYTYDKSKRLTAQASSSGESHYFTHNQRNMVTQLQDVGGAADALRTFTYNAIGERTFGIDGTASPSYWSYDGGIAIRENLNASNTRYRIARGVLAEFDAVDGSTFGYAVMDHARSVKTLVASATPPGNNYYEFDSYGDRLGVTDAIGGSPPNRMQFSAGRGLLRLKTTQEAYAGSLYLPGIATLLGLVVRVDPRSVFDPRNWRRVQEQPEGCKPPYKSPVGCHWEMAPPPPYCAWKNVRDDNPKLFCGEGIDPFEPGATPLVPSGPPVFEPGPETPIPIPVIPVTPTFIGVRGNPTVVPVAIGAHLGLVASAYGCPNLNWVQEVTTNDPFVDPATGVPHPSPGVDGGNGPGNPLYHTVTLTDPEATGTSGLNGATYTDTSQRNRIMPGGTTWNAVLCMVCVNNMDLTILHCWTWGWASVLNNAPPPPFITTPVPFTETPGGTPPQGFTDLVPAQCPGWTIH